MNRLEAAENLPENIVLERAILEYKKESLTPELVDTTWQIIWKTWGDRVGHTLRVPSCDRTTKELEKLQKEGKAILLVPDELYTKEGLVLLGRMFPKMRSWSVSEQTTVTNEHNKGGSIDIEMDLDSPHRNTREKQAVDILRKEGRTGQRLATLIVGSQFSKLSTDRYLDEGATWSRLPGSRLGGLILHARFCSDGRLDVRWHLGRESHGPRLGFRSEGVKKA